MPPPAAPTNLDPPVDGIRDRIGPLAGRNRINAAFYDGPSWARFRPWERLFLTFQGGARWARRQILRHLDGLGPAARLLEVGIGDGENLRFLPPGWAVAGADIARTQLVACLGRHPGTRDRLAWAEAEALPFGDGEFDACYSIGGFTYFGDHARALAEMARVVRPGGRLVVADELPHIYRYGIGRLVGRPAWVRWWLERFGVDPEFATMILDFDADPEAAVRRAWPGATRHAIWAGLGYCYAATRPGDPSAPLAES